MREYKSIDYARAAIETIMRKFTPEKLPPAGKFHYHQGVFLSGVLKANEYLKEQKYYDYAKAYVDTCINERGILHKFDCCMLDDIQPAILLPELMKKAFRPGYEQALITCMTIIKNWKRNPVGGFWHKEYHPNEMWLDGLYMAGPLQALYAELYGEADYLENAYRQAFIMYDNMKKSNGLLFHAWDYYKQIDWADKEKGLSAEVWGRALGWYLVASMDIMEIEKNSKIKSVEKKEKAWEEPQGAEGQEVAGEINSKNAMALRGIVRIVLEELAKYQDKDTGMWYQVVDKPEEQGNWVESSCTALFVYSLVRAVRLGILDKAYLDIAIKGYQGLLARCIELDKTEEGLTLRMNGICVGTGVCSYEEYITRPTSCNDLHGLGAFLLMCAEIYGYIGE